MSFVGKKDAIILFFGDILSFALALWITLFVRYSELPGYEKLYDHFIAFLPVFGFWILIFFIYGLYDKQTTALKGKLPDTIFSVSIFNGIIALVFFYLFPFPNITPKINLLLTLIFSVALVSLWRIFLFGYVKTSRIGNVLIIGKGAEMDALFNELLRNKSFGMIPLRMNDFEEDLLSKMKVMKTRNVIVNLRGFSDPNNAQIFYKLLFAGVNLIDAEEIYESLFGKVSLNYVNDEWFVQNRPNSPKVIYDIFKRTMDIIASFVLGILSLILYPFVYIAIKLDDGGQVLFSQERVGKNGKLVKIIKFRTMQAIDSGRWVTEGDPRITRVGNFLRKTRIDELPQLWNVLLGDISLIGPRPEVLHFVDVYDKQIPYYNMRHLIKPGLSGWAQIHHDKPPQSVEETKEKLAYDLYYIKNRSIVLDVEIALKTIKTLLSRSGM